jgi:hypothetical protein
MDKALAEELNRSLRSYRIFLEAFEPGYGDGFIALGEREFLHKHTTHLSETQRIEMASIDARAMDFAKAKYSGVEEDDDVRIIRHIAKLALGEVGLDDLIE